MKAVRYQKYGTPNVLEVKDVPVPGVKMGEVRVRVHAASVTAADSMMRQGNPFIGRLFLGLLRPKTQSLGTGFAGIVDAVGQGVSKFKPGDAVFGETIFGHGSNAEFTVLPETGLILSMPDAISFEEAAVICDGALTDLNFLRDLANIKPGDNVLIIGASGSLGTAAVQMATLFGASVTGVSSAANADLVKSLGAGRVIDYRRRDFTQMGETWDIIYDTVGAHSFRACKNSLTPDGVYLSPVFGLGHFLQMAWTGMFNGKKAKFSATGMRPGAELRDMLAELQPLFAAGKMVSIIDRRYQLHQIAEAHRYVDSGRKRGNVVVLP